MPTSPPKDVPLLLMANAGLVEATGDSAAAASRRLVGLMLAAFRATGTDDVAPRVDPRATFRAMRRAGRVRGSTATA